MTQATRGLLTLAILLIGAACASAPTSAGTNGGASGLRTRSGQITFEEIQQRGQYTNLYDLVQNLRPRWLWSQGPDRFLGPQGQVQVHMDGNRMGSVNALRNLSMHGVTSIEWVPPIEAAARYGLNHSHGAIIISTALIH